MKAAGKLTWNFTKIVNQPGYYHDGNGLYLRVTPTGGKSWAYRYWINGRLRELGLGSVDRYDNLVEVREAHAKFWHLFKVGGIDPIEFQNGLKKYKEGQLALAVMKELGVKL